MQTERDDKLEAYLHRQFQRDPDGNLLPIPTRYTGDLETRGIVLVEPSGGGKTTAVKRVLQRMDVLRENPETGMPRYVQLQVPSPASLKSVGIAVLAATGLPGMSEKSTTGTAIWDVVRHRLSEFGFVVLWLDEAQDLVLAKSASETETTLRMLKSLMQGENAVIPILSGTQRLSEMTNFDPQVSRRFLKITPRALELGADEDMIGDLIAYYCGEVAMRAKLAEDLASRLIYASRQRFGRVVETIIAAIEIALSEGAEVLSGEHFAEAWTMQEGCEISHNVFLATDWSSIPLDTGAEEYEMARSQRQRKKLARC